MVVAAVAFQEQLEYPAAFGIIEGRGERDLLPSRGGQVHRAGVDQGHGADWCVVRRPTGQGRCRCISQVDRPVINVPGCGGYGVQVEPDLTDQTGSAAPSVGC